MADWFFLPKVTDWFWAGGTSPTPQGGVGTPPLVYRPACPPTTRWSDRNFWNHKDFRRRRNFLKSCHSICMKMACKCVNYYFFNLNGSFGDLIFIKMLFALLQCNNWALFLTAIFDPKNGGSVLTDRLVHRPLGGRTVTFW